MREVLIPEDQLETYMESVYDGRSPEIRYLDQKYNLLDELLKYTHNKKTDKLLSLYINKRFTLWLKKENGKFRNLAHFHPDQFSLMLSEIERSLEGMRSFARNSPNVWTAGLAFNIWLNKTIFIQRAKKIIKNEKANWHPHNQQFLRVVDREMYREYNLRWFNLLFPESFYTSSSPTKATIKYLIKANSYLINDATFEEFYGSNNYSKIQIKIKIYLENTLKKIKNLETPDSRLAFVQQHLRNISFLREDKVLKQLHQEIRDELKEIENVRKNLPKDEALVKYFVDNFEQAEGLRNAQISLDRILTELLPNFNAEEIASFNTQLEQLVSNKLGGKFFGEKRSTDFIRTQIPQIQQALAKQANNSSNLTNTHANSFSLELNFYCFAVKKYIDDLRIGKKYSSPDQEYLGAYIHRIFRMEYAGDTLDEIIDIIGNSACKELLESLPVDKLSLGAKYHPGCNYWLGMHHLRSKLPDTQRAYQYFLAGKDDPRCCKQLALFYSAPADSKYSNVVDRDIGQALFYYTKSSHAHLQMGELYEEQENFVAALECYQTQVREQENWLMEKKFWYSTSSLAAQKRVDSSLWQRAAEQCKQEQNLEKAREHYRKAIEFNLARKEYLEQRHDMVLLKVYQDDGLLTSGWRTERGIKVRKDMNEAKTYAETDKKLKIYSDQNLQSSSYELEYQTAVVYAVDNVKDKLGDCYYAMSQLYAEEKSSAGRQMRIDYLWKARQIGHVQAEQQYKTLNSWGYWFKNMVDVNAWRYWLGNVKKDANKLLPNIKFFTVKKDDKSASVDDESTNITTVENVQRTG